MTKRKAIFLDRDGTLVVHVPYLNSPDQLKLLPNAVRGIRLFKEHGYLIIIVTNQSGIARGFFNEECLTFIHERLKDMLEKEGVTIDDIYYCPHYRKGAVERYRIDCDCRKPKSKMIYDAAAEYHIDLKQSFMIGDSETDMVAGKNAGCTCILIKDTEIHGQNSVSGIDADYCVKDLFEAAKLFAR
ncbi:MAG: HAD family hydrolase [wastewater metagenome]|nr:HAD family hydrolase [Candidatus Loosdrechtia aerotolerans]